MVKLLLPPGPSPNVKQKPWNPRVEYRIRFPGVSCPARGLKLKFYRYVGKAGQQSSAVLLSYLEHLAAQTGIMEAVGFPEDTGPDWTM
jgi:hypothetical protein